MCNWEPSEPSLIAQLLLDQERPAVTEYSILFPAGLMRINSLPHEISFGITTTFIKSGYANSSHRYYHWHKLRVPNVSRIGVDNSIKIIKTAHKPILQARYLSAERVV